VNGQLRCCMLLKFYACLANADASDLADVMDAAGDSCDALALAVEHAHQDIAAWLLQSVDWITPLHYLSVARPQRVKQLLRDGAGLHATLGVGRSTPLTIARQLHDKGQAPTGSAAWLVLSAAQPWSRATHELFPNETRRRAAELCHVGSLLAYRFSPLQGALLDVWTEVLLPLALFR